MQDGQYQERGMFSLGRPGNLLLSGSLFVLSFLLTIITSMYIGMSNWLVVPLVLFFVLSIVLFRFKQARFSFWKLVLAFMLYLILLGVLIFFALPDSAMVGI